MSQQPEDTVGLDLFDETASAAGSFPHSMLGYERQAVDAYIRDIERQLSSAKRKVRSLQRQLATQADETDYSRLGTHTVRSRPPTFCTTGTWPAMPRCAGPWME